MCWEKTEKIMTIRNGTEGNVSYIQLFRIVGAASANKKLT